MPREKKFSEINKEIQMLKLTSPAYVSSVHDPDLETEEQLDHRFEKLFTLPGNIYFKLGFHDTANKIRTIGQKYGFDLPRLANITRLIREYYFGEVRLEDFGREIEKRMSVSLLTAQEIARQIRSEIINWDPWAEFLAKLPKLPIREILKKYPSVGEQEISSSDIELKSHPDDLFAPSIRNWVNDYILHLGQVKHGTIDRTQYLFHSENAKSLSSPEREKLGVILKSFDENTPLPVDAENNEVVFDAVMEHGTHNIEQARETVLGRKTFPQKAQLQENFIRPYPPTSRFVGNEAGRSPTELKPTARPRPIQNKIPDARYPPKSLRESKRVDQIPNTDNLRFTNPYPSPGTHEVSQQKEVIENGSGSPLVVKGMTQRQNISRAEPTPEQFVRPKREIIDPISYIPPEPKIEGNIVDLSMNNDQRSKNNSE